MIKAIAIGLCAFAAEQTVAAFDVADQFRLTRTLVYTTDGSFEFQHEAATSDFGPWFDFSVLSAGAPSDVLYAYNVQDSTTSPTQFRGEGGVQTDTANAANWNVWLENFLAVQFYVDEPLTVRAVGYVQHTGPDTLAVFQLAHGTELLVNVFPPPGESAYFDLEIPLAMGAYALYAHATVLDAPTSGTAWADWHLDFAIVPEPSTALLCILTVGCRRRRSV